MAPVAVLGATSFEGSDVPDPEFPAPEEGFLLTHFLVVADQDRSRDWYQRVFDADILLERSPVILKAANSWIILNEGGGPTADKPNVILETPADPDRVSAFLNVRVADIYDMQERWRQVGVQFLTDPVRFDHEIRAYLRDPDGHLIEVGQSTDIPGD